MSATRDEETTPLLRDGGSDGDGPSSHDHPSVAIEPVRVVNVKATLSIVVLLIVIAMFSNFMSIPAQNVIFEKIICENYFSATNGTSHIPLPYQPIEGAPVLDDPCKSEPVQSELGYILGWKDTFEMIPTLLIGLPFGIIADRVGRRPIMFNSLLWTAVAEFAARVICHWSDIFPLRAVWYANVFHLLGGGAPVASSMIYTLIADITTPDKRADIYVILQGVLLIAESVGTALGAAIADTGHPWIAYMACPIGIFLSAFFAFAIPETQPHKIPLEPDDGSNESPRKTSLTQRMTALQPRAWPRRLGRWALRSLQALWHNLSLVCLVVVFLISLVRRQAQAFLVLYASKKFHWPLGRASYLSGLRSAVNLVLLLLIIPALTHWLLRYMSAARKDLLLLRVQAAFITLGALLIALAAHPAPLVGGVFVFALGAGFDVNARSLATSLVQRTHFATLNTCLAFSEALGMMCAGPVLASTWHTGLVLGGPYLGLPFVVSALVFAAALLVSAFIRVSDAEEEGEAQERQSLLSVEG